MTQLVGSTCGRCGRMIESVTEGKFCPACGLAHHHDCQPPRDRAFEAVSCSVCGCMPPSQVEAPRPTPQQKWQEAKAPLGGYPISKVCPSCGNAEFKKRRPDRLVAFTYDRICRACGTRYTPPTPLWAALAFLLVGLVLLGFGGTSVIFAVLSGQVVGIPAMLCNGFLAILGLLAIGQGITGLFSAGKAKS